MSLIVASLHGQKHHLESTDTQNLDAATAHCCLQTSPRPTSAGVGLPQDVHEVLGTGAPYQTGALLLHICANLFVLLVVPPGSPKRCPGHQRHRNFLVGSTHDRLCDLAPGLATGPLLLPHIEGDLLCPGSFFLAAFLTCSSQVCLSTL